MATRTRGSRFLVGLGLLVALLAGGCGDPGQPFDDFLARADRTPPELPSDGMTGVLTDIRGDYLYNIALKPLGDVYLRLRVTFTQYDLDENGTGALVAGEFRFPDETLEDTPLASFETSLDSAGHMTIDVGHVRIEADRSPIEDTAVETDFSLDVTVLDTLNMCGAITDDESVVTQPIQLLLKGTTFGGERYGELGQIPVDVPVECPHVDNGPEPDLDAGDVDDASDAGDLDAGDMGLQPPDVDLGTGQRADVSGRFWLKAALTGTTLALDLLVDITYHESENGASVDGSLRSVRADPGDPAIAQFSEPVDDNGEFSVVVMGLMTDSALGPVEADIALAGIIVDADTLCGEAAGFVTSPLNLNLRGTTFGAVRIPADSTEEPEDAISACPE